jgi:hypothetical protein
MHAVVRRYSGPGAPELFEEFERKHGSVEESLEKAMRGVPGLVAYTLVRTQEGGLSVTVCEDKAATEKSVQVARDWIRQNLTASANPPEVLDGDVILQLT